MSKYITKNCLQCQQEFNASLRELNRGYAKFCSLSCSTKFNKQIENSKKLPNASCAECGMVFYVTETRRLRSKSGLLFCTRVCKNKAQRIESNAKAFLPAHYGTGCSSRAYRRIAFSTYPSQCNRCCWNEIRSVLHVHHMDRNRKNNNADNLEILCPRCHEVEHYNARDGMHSKVRILDRGGVEPPT